MALSDRPGLLRGLYALLHCNNNKKSNNHLSKHDFVSSNGFGCGVCVSKFK